MLRLAICMITIQMPSDAALTRAAKSKVCQVERKLCVTAEGLVMEPN